MKYNVAVVGATGAVGQLVLKLLAERKFPCTSLKPIASARSAGQSIRWGDQTLQVEALSPWVFDGIDLVIASTPDEVAGEFVPWAVERGAVVVDESAFHRMRPEVPLVVPEVNPHAIERSAGIIASPNCSTTQLVVCLKPLHRAVGIKRVVVATYQAASGAGVAGQRDLEQGTRQALQGHSHRYETFVQPLAFNLIPQIGSPKQAGYTSEEMKMVYETHKILEDDTIEVCPTCVRVPVVNCHSESIYIECSRAIAAEEAREILAAAPGITVWDDLLENHYPMPMTVSGRDDVVVGRIRQDLYRPQALSFWCVSDNLRKGAATNAVQIAELIAANKRLPCVS
ncbi:MAG TPA: aspartate-semialdehyde dehydrogenase [Pirellulaceae bacterium]|nr:aspartate-semialdehyde dehydrogenase [Pirellulaceae bacterium]